MKDSLHDLASLLIYGLLSNKMYKNVSKELNAFTANELDCSMVNRIARAIYCHHDGTQLSYCKYCAKSRGKLATQNFIS